ncbi:hypothetical protein Q8A67_004409 [Cirrhinus molitorella]|uniref:TIR domain-containing protein n=1 Tax=Cirrhinus molitorella TaxID=172907 RepID=A0AA88QCT2_9TELE|nr:hypothetical protein Q8A67_004409 [Cirrhinus molitorella]
MAVRMRPLGAKETIIVFILIFQSFDYCRTCHCDLQYFCNCSSNHLQHVPKVPANALGLDLSFNQIESIDMNDLSPYSELKTLNFHKNKLKFIHKEAFKSQHKLEVLDLSFNNLKNLSSSWFHQLKSLQQLNLVGNPYTTLGPAPIFQPLLNLRTLRFGSPSLREVYKNGLDSLAYLDEMTFVGSNLRSYENGSLKAARPIGLVSLSLQSLFQNDPELVSKVLQDVSHPETLLTIKNAELRTNTSTEAFKATREEKCSWPASLRFLNLSSTKIRKMTPCLPSSLTALDLSENDLTVFNQRFPQLITLTLTGNRFMTLPHGELLPRLQTLLIQRNALRMFNRSDLKRFKTLQYLEAGDNNFVCSCEFVSFFKQDVDLFITLRDGRRNYVCNTPFILRVLGLIVVTCHKLHVIWYLQMTKAWIQAKRKPAVGRLAEELRYDAFVSYSQHDAEWVEEILVPELESAQPPFALCLHKRDFQPGRWIVDNIIDSIEKSHRTLFVLSEHFVTSEWCRYELDFSHFRIVDEHNDSAVLVLLEPIKKETIPKRFCKLRKIMNSRTYLEWPEEEEKRSEFWSNLRAVLQRDEC